MNVINIKPVQSGQSKAVIGIAGQSGDGKTLTALYIARGMVDKASEIGFLDTENKRGSLYANVLDGKFMIGDLYPPFSPTRYAQAIRQFQDSGIKVLVIDSVTHEWEGDGGCDDIANAPKADGSARKIANWIGAKKEHKTFMNVLLQSNMNIICCIRAREKTDFKDPAKPVSQGLQPICEKNFMFEMTASIMMANQGKKQIPLKVPEFLKETFGDGNGYLGIETGLKLRKWLGEGEKESDEVIKLKSEIQMACEGGVVALEKIWHDLTPEMQIALKDHFRVCKESAKEYDRQRLPIDNDFPTQDLQEQARIEKFIKEAKTKEELDTLNDVEMSEDNSLYLEFRKSELKNAIK